jgi:glycosidase
MKQSILVILLCVILSGFATVHAQQDPVPQPDWWESGVWYLLFVRSFYDSDGDGIGDLQGVIEKLDYLNDGNPETTSDLGVAGIWLMPVMESPSYHGYDATDYRTIERDYGTNEDFLQLMEEAHARGIRVIVDLVLNHTSSQHPWFLASASRDPQYADWYRWADQDNGDKQPWSNDRVWHRNNTRGQYYYGVFYGGMPDLNHENPAVTAEIRDIARFWIEEMGVDGFRLDAIRYLIEVEVNGRTVLADAPVNREYLRAFNEYVHSLNPDIYTVGEVLLNTPNIISRYTEEGAVDQAFEFALAEDIISAAASGNKREVLPRVDMTLYEYGTGDFATLTGNHDFDRLMSQLQGNEGFNRAAIAMLMTLPGTPYLYYGEEIGMEGVKPDELIRRPMQWDTTPVTGGFTTATPWQALDADFARRTVAGQQDDPDSLLSYYRDLIHLRNAHPALQTGETTTIDASYRSIFSYLRYNDEETLLIVHNLDDNDSKDYLLTLEEGSLADITGAELLYSTETNVELNLPTVNEQGGFSDYLPIVGTLPPHSLYVIRLLRSE